MQCYIFAGDYKPFTTNSGSHKGYRYEQSFTNSEVLCDRRGHHHAVEFHRHAVVELVDASVVRLARYYVLAGFRSPGVEQNTVRRIPWSAWPSHLLASSHDGALGSYDARRTGEVS